MDASQTSTQLRAGIFLAIGLLAIFSLALYFGRFSQWSGSYYPITVKYTDASGVIKGADVLLAGARIGDVEESPKVLPSMRGVSVKLRIDSKVQIPAKSRFAIGSSGLLGDRFIAVALPEEDEEEAGKAAFLKPNSVVDGERESSLADLENEIGNILPKVNQAVSNINQITDHLKKDVFNKEGIAQLQGTLSNVHETSAVVLSSSKQFDSLIDQASHFLSKANDTMNDAEVAAEDLKFFLNNLRRHGLIFYHDSSRSKK
jgi:phospholipid/cholesterol/gamma-HCH transport system substrate-binding protein